jgi:hypothetical protein
MLRNSNVQSVEWQTTLKKEFGSNVKKSGNRNLLKNEQAMM